MRHTHQFQLKKSILSLSVAVVVWITRITQLPANFKPLGAYGFFGNPLLYFLSIVSFDFLVGGFYAGFIWTYIGFAAYPLLGQLAKKSNRRAVILLPLASLSFFLLSNFGVWWGWYPHSVQGLLTCYLLALPFYTRTFASDLLFGYSYVLVKNKGTIASRVSQLLIYPKVWLKQI